MTSSSDKPQRLFVKHGSVVNGQVIATTYPHPGALEYALQSAVLRDETRTEVSRSGREWEVPADRPTISPENAKLADRLRKTANRLDLGEVVPGVASMMRWAADRLTTLPGPTAESPSPKPADIAKLMSRRRGPK